MFLKQRLYSFHFFLFFSILAFMSVFTTSGLCADGWGQTDDAYEFEDVSWRGVYFDMNGLSFGAFVPNYSGTLMQNSNVCFKGEAGNSLYLIMTSLNPCFSPPDSEQEFLQMIQEANPLFYVLPADARELGAVYAVDLIPVDDNTHSYWRFLCTKDRLIKMVNADENEIRRIHFFEGMKIQP
ncbi:MAG: hypothetical protein Tsb0021_14740 [Chlamydiales bacterium]